ncbi:helix-turn-helix domain-containing protein [Chitinophaga sp.]|uniref:winged helix-turn-helix transcriptional regulator n=1 Tax=Chitinophaga sp. TaxID=1869181 RepID=UPI0031DB52AD
MDFKCDKDKVFSTAELRLMKDALYVLGGKWKLDVIRSIAAGNTRFSEIQKSLPKINTRMLSKELKELEANHIVERKTIDDFPPVTIYTFTAYSKKLAPIFESLIEWANTHRNEIFKVP